MERRAQRTLPLRAMQGGVLLGAMFLTGVIVVSLVTGPVSAGTAPASNTTDFSRINVDSLYTVLAAQETAPDTSSLEVLAPDRTLTGRASWYGPGFHGRRTASGERFDRNEMTAAHRSLAFGTLVRVVDNRSGRSVLVRINDRGPYAHGRILDLSQEAARRLGISGRGTAHVELQVYQPDANELISFDSAGRAIDVRGFSVRVARLPDFEKALAHQRQLTEAGHDNVLLTRIRVDGRTEYQVSIGLFSTERLCRSLLAELAEGMDSVALVKFTDGGAVETLLADQ